MEHGAHMAQQQMLPQAPKGRGRPRASFAQTGELDLGLIREYRQRPALYDRSSKRFKDKVYVAQQWQVISHKLGYDVSLLRDRMLQLRNRYNIEKRRLEMLRVDNPQAYVGSQWPLYESLNFLSDHIRTRRSYKTMTKSLDGKQEEFESYEMDDMRSESEGHVPVVKVEFDGPDDNTDVHALDEDDDDDYDEDCEHQLPVTTMLNIPRNESQQLNGTNGRGMTSPSSSTGTLPYNHHRAGHQRQRLPLIVAAPKQKLPTLDAGPAAKRRLEAYGATKITSHKFRAFGEFMSHSLSDLPEPMGLRLVEKFTSDLVQAALSVGQQQTKQAECEDNHGSDN